MKKILCLSGGMDSVIAWYWLNKPECIFFHTGLSYSDMEVEAIHRIGIPCTVDHSLDFSNEANIYIPHRNLLFASRASATGAYEVVIAGLKDDKVEDKTFKIMSHCLSCIGKKPVLVTSPFWEFTKEQICKWFMGNVPRAGEILALSISCYNGINRKPCCECESCFRKACALYSVGIMEEFHNKGMMYDYRERALRGAYEKTRCESIIRYVDRK
jgi:7-cyano-7-deazaguanine synthase in queuosine biosynthesis